MLDRLNAAPVDRVPFPHCVVDSVFPDDFYQELLEQWPEDSAFVRLVDTKRVGKTYSPQRLVIQLGDAAWKRMNDDQAPFWRDEVYAWLKGARFSAALARKFADITAPRLESVNGRMGPDALLVSDRGGYELGPHTDAPHRLVSALFYLALDEWTFAESIGTTLFVPRDPAFISADGPAYGFDAFRPAKRIAFLPNRLFVFPKTDRSFHGVEPIRIEGIDRRVLMFDIRIPVRAPAPAAAS